MTLYTVVDASGKDVRMTTIYEHKARKMALNYRGCGDWYVDEYELDYDVEFDDDENPTEINFYEDRELTAVWGDNNAIRSIIDKRIAEMFDGTKATYELDYTDNGTAGYNANFTCSNLKFI